MKPQNATPTPWKIISENEYAIYFGVDDLPYVGLCRFSDNPNMPRERAITNAAHIINCVNSHEKLVESNKKLAFYLEDLIEQIEQFPIRTGINMSHAKQALKSAGEI